MKIKISIAVLFIVLTTVIYSHSLFAQTDEQPNLTIISPEENTQIFGSKINVSFIVNNFIFTNFSDRPKKALGEGHLHVWLDKDTALPEEATEIVKATDFSLEDIPEGNHQLIMELVNNNHTSFKPKIIKSVNFITNYAPFSPTPSAFEITPKENTQTDNSEVKKIQAVGKINLVYTLGLITIALFFLLGVIYFWKRKL